MKLDPFDNVNNVGVALLGDEYGRDYQRYIDDKAILMPGTKMADNKATGHDIDLANYN